MKQTMSIAAPVQEDHWRVQAHARGGRARRGQEGPDSRPVGCSAERRLSSHLLCLRAALLALCWHVRHSIEYCIFLAWHLRVQ